MSDATSDRPVKPLVEDRLGTRARIYGTEQAILVGLDTGHGEVAEDGHLAELESLADTAGIPVLATVVQKRQRVVPATFVGKGKLEEVRAAADELGADVAIFNEALTPAQARNLEETLHLKVIDRTQLIMDIFAQRAATKEARLQVELAQLRYLLPRLRGWGTSLTRTGGGIGTRGPGETQLEIDRNKITLRIHALEKKMAKTATERGLRRKRRERNDIPQIALVGYTNSGKSTLLNALTDGDAMVEDKLFATLDTRVRRGPVSPGHDALFIDTVGFIKDLPHNLVPAFAATLEAARYADLVLHVTDISSPTWKNDYRSVLDTLEEEVYHESDERPPMLDILNKIDLAPEGYVESLDGVAISAREGARLDDLKDRIAEVLFADDQTCDVVVPFDVLGVLHSLELGARATISEYTEEGARVQAVLSLRERDVLRRAGVRISACDASPDGSP